MGTNVLWNSKEDPKLWTVAQTDADATSLTQTLLSDLAKDTEGTVAMHQREGKLEVIPKPRAEGYIEANNTRAQNPGIQYQFILPDHFPVYGDIVFRVDWISEFDPDGPSSPGPFADQPNYWQWGVELDFSEWTKNVAITSASMMTSTTYRRHFVMLGTAIIDTIVPRAKLSFLCRTNLQFDWRKDLSFLSNIAMSFVWQKMQFVRVRDNWLVVPYDPTFFTD